MKQIKIDNVVYWYNVTSGVLYFNKSGKKRVPERIFNVSQYQQFLNQIQKLQTI